MLNHIKMFPHCDSRILHAPGACQHCDKFPEWQELREMWDINFTGKNDPNKATCPAEVRRKLDTIDKWPGNRPA